MSFIKACLLLAGFAFSLVALAPSHAQAIGWCGGSTSYCFNKDTKKYLGQSRIDTCWSWKKMACAPCTGGKGEFATKCNKEHWRCKGNCVACPDINGGGQCSDKHGNLHPLK
jgi:hypothetical protein